VQGRWSIELGKSGISPDLKRFNCPCPAECGRRLAFVSLEPSNGDSPIAPAAQAALLMKLRRLRKELLEFCAMFSRGWTATRCSEKCVFIGTLPVNKSKRQTCGCLP